MKLTEKIANDLKQKYNIGNVDVAIVVGSGQADGVPDLQNKLVVGYDELGLPTSRVKGHSGTFVFGQYKNKKIVLVSRLHYYENGSIEMVRMPLEICNYLGIKNVILLTSSGGLNKQFNVGDLMVINDQINLSGVNPLVGVENLKFTNMSNCYDEELRDKFKEIARSKNIDLREGVFCQTSGPTYETLAEAEMLRTLGGDAVSMSTAHDCIVARYFDMRVLGVSIIVNVHNGISTTLCHEEVLENAARANVKLKTLLEGFLE